MAITTTTGFLNIANATNGAINGAYVTSSNNGFNIAADTIYGVPAHIWHSMSNREQCQHADRYKYEMEYRRQEYERNAHLRSTMDTMAAATPKHAEPTFLTNTKLLLTGAES